MQDPLPDTHAMCCQLLCLTCGQSAAVEHRVLLQLKVLGTCGCILAVLAAKHYHLFAGTAGVNYRMLMAIVWAAAVLGLADSAGDPQC